METIQMLLREFGGMLLPCLFALPIILLCRFLTYRKTGVWNKRRELLVILFFVYLTAILSRTVIPEALYHGQLSGAFHLPWKEPSMVQTKPVIGWIQWMITLHNTAELVRNIGGNILLFVPYGFLLPLAFEKQGKYTVLYGLLLTLFIETEQLFTERITDLNDIIMNVFGVLIGYLFYRLVLIIIIHKKKAERK